MDFSTIAGLVFGIFIVGLLMVMGGDPRIFIDSHAGTVIFGGATAATMIRFSFATVMHGIPTGLKYSFSVLPISENDLINEIARLADVARKQGPIGLEKETSPDSFLNKGTRLIADGYDSEFIRNSLETDRDIYLTHMKEGANVYRAIGDCAPAWGMVGTLIGMVQMFANMSDPSKLGPSMAVALLATLYGALLANLLCIPIADKLHVRQTMEEINRSLVIDGVLMIRESKSPQVIKEMLQSYVPEKHREHEEEEEGEALAAAA